jgi:Flp pilus assembly protein TadG
MLSKLCKNLLQSNKAATAVIFAITVPLIVGGAALAVDVASFRVVQSRMQSAVDAAALTSVMEIEKKGDVITTAVDTAAANAPLNFGAMTTAADVTIGTYSKAGGFVPGVSATSNAVRVIAERTPARSNGVARIFGLLWGTGQVSITTTAIAARPVNVFYEPPEGAVLDNEAGDFNEMYAYCFDMKGTGDDASRRTQMTLIANNLKPGDTTSGLTKGVYTAMPATPMQWPDCSGKDLSLSFRLLNVRTAKSIPAVWQKPAKDRVVIDHYTDTMIDNKGVETFKASTSKILETVLCDTSAKCDPSKPGTSVVTGKNRYNTKSTAGACAPGKFMYFGFEDSAGVNGVSVGGSWTDLGWTDYDYNDIAIRMKCPSSGRLADPYPRLVG